MLQVHVRRSGRGTPGHLIILAVLIVVLIIAVAWGIRHRPTRRPETSPPPTLAVEASPSASAPPAGTGTPAPTPTLGPNDVMVYTLDGQLVCSGYPIGDLGYHLRCGLPAGARLFRVVDAAGASTLAVRYTDQVVVRVGPK